MDLILLAKALVQGIVEGLTEFLPVSSTGHLIVSGSLLNFNDEKGKVFEIVIQAGAILAVCWEFRAKLIETFRGILSEAKAQRFAINLFVAFLPAAVIGVLTKRAITDLLFKPVPVATAFIVGGFIIFFAERWYRGRAADSSIRMIDSVDELSWKDALKIGFAQCLALIPGTSRSGATIIGGLFFGLSRRCATEFSFFLAIPIIFGATVYSLYKERALLSAADWPMFTVGSLAAMVSAFVVVRWLIRYVSSHDFTIFAWYRIAFGLVILGTAYTGLVNWA